MFTNKENRSGCGRRSLTPAVEWGFDRDTDQRLRAWMLVFDPAWAPDVRVRRTVEATPLYELLEVQATLPWWRRRIIWRAAGLALIASLGAMSALGVGRSTIGSWLCSVVITTVS